MVGLLASSVRAMAAAAYFVGMATATAFSIGPEMTPSSAMEEGRCGLPWKRCGLQLRRSGGEGHAVNKKRKEKGKNEAEEIRWRRVCGDNKKEKRKKG